MTNPRAFGVACAICLLASALLGGARPSSAIDRSQGYTAFSGEYPVTITGHAEDAMEPFLARDGKTLFFNNSNADPGKTDLFSATRVSDQAFTARGPVGGANSPALDAVPSMDKCGRFYFVSTRSYFKSLSTIYSARFSDGRVIAPELVAGVSLLKLGMLNFDAEISADGNSLWLVDGKFSGKPFPDTARIVLAQRQGAGFVRRADSARLLASVNAVGLNYAPSISSDGLELYFTRISDPRKPLPQIYRASRPNPSAAFENPQPVAALTGFVEAPALSADGRLLYYHKRVGDTYRLYFTRRVVSHPAAASSAR